ncbi:MAG: PepSY domain-containing protein [Acidimicrobiales bacterium]
MPAPATGRIREQRRRRALRSSALGLGALAMVGGGLLAAAPSALAASSAPTHGKTTCAIAGDECTNAINYANANDGGGATVLAVGADTEAHGGAVSHRVFDIRMQTNTGVYDLHVFRNDSPPYNDGVWWQKLAENQNPGGGSGSGGSSGGGGSTDSAGSDAPQISASQAATGATSFVSGKGRQVLSVKHNQLKSEGQKDYYQVKLQLGDNGRKAGTTNVWVDATSTSGIVTAASGSGLSYRDTNLVPASTAQANAVKATGGGVVYKTNLNGGKWRWYWVFVRNGSTKYKVSVDAVTGVVTQVHQN